MIGARSMSARPAPRRTLRGRPELTVALAAIPAATIVGLLGLVFVTSFQETFVDRALTLRHYADLYADPLVVGAFQNTLGLAASCLVVSVTFGVAIGWLVERTDFRGKGLVYTIMTIGVIVPGYFTAMGWLFMLHPRIGVVNRLLMDAFGLSEAPLSVVNVPAMGAIVGLSLTSVAFIMTSASLRTMDASLEEAAAMSGAGFLTTLRRITFPLVTPGILAAALYVFTIAISAFDVPAVIGLSNRILTFSTFLFVRMNPQRPGELVDYGLLAAFSTGMVLLALAISWWYARVLRQARRYEVISGKNYRPRQTRLGRWALAAWVFVIGYLLLARGLPLVVAIWIAFLPYPQQPSLEALQSLTLRNFTSLPWEDIARAVRNTLILAIGAPTLALAMSLLFSWVILKSRTRARFAFDLIAFLPHAIPSTIFAFAAIVVTITIPGPLYRSLFVLFVLFAITQLSFGTRVTNSALIQIHHELIEAAQMSGASLWGVVRTIVLPLLRPALSRAWLWLMMLTVVELTLPVVLFSPQNATLSTVIWLSFELGESGRAAAQSLIVLAALLPVVLLYWRAVTRFEARR